VIEADWLSEFPLEWRELRADFLCNPYRVAVSPERYEGTMVAHYSIPQVQETGGPLVEPADDIDSTKLLISSPTLLVSKLNPRKRTICIAEPQGDLVTLASGEFVPIQSDQFHRRYGYYVWLSEKVTDRLSAIVQSATRSHQRVNPSDILKLPWKWPPLETQERIATFLDKKTAQIDGLIGRKQALLERLAEKRQGLITRGVTKGLNPAASMKDSGIEWLGQIPAHWEVKRLSFVSQVIDCKHRTPEYIDDGIPLVSTSEISPYRIDYDTKRQVSQQELGLMSEGGRQPRAFDIIYSRNASVGSAALVRDDRTLCLGQDLCLIRPSKNSSHFLEHFLNSTACLEQLGSYLVGATLKRVNVDVIKKYALPWPPQDEQIRISAFLSAEIAKIEAVEQAVSSSTAALLEYRSTLITSAVTGQIEGLR